LNAFAFTASQGSGEGGAQTGYTIATQATVQRPAAHLGVDELTRHRKQIVKREAQCAPQLNGNPSFGLKEARKQAISCVRAVIKIVATAPS
jgi:hypothetical protein